MILIGVLFNSHLLSMGRNDFFLNRMHWRRFKGGQKARDRGQTVIICFPLHLPDFEWVFRVWNRNDIE